MPAASLTKGQLNDLRTGKPDVQLNADRHQWKKRCRTCWTMHQVFSDARWFLRGRSITFKEAIVDINRMHPGANRTQLRRELAAATFFFQRSFILGLLTATSEQRTRMLAALTQFQNDGMEAMINPEFTQNTAEQLWKGLNCHQFLGQLSNEMAWSFTCRHTDCLHHSMGDLWLQTKIQADEHGHFGCCLCVRLYSPFRTSSSLTDAQRCFIVKMNATAEDKNTKDVASFVQDCNNDVQYRHYLTKWPNTSIKLLEAKLSLSFHNIKDECQTWTAEQMYELIAHHAKKHHQESCWTKTRLDGRKIAEIDEANKWRTKKWKYDYLPRTKPAITRTRASTCGRRTPTTWTKKT